VQQSVWLMASSASEAATAAGGPCFNLLLSRAVLLWSLFACHGGVAAASIMENSAVLTVEAVAAMLMGAAVCLAGYRFLSATAFACGFLFGGLATAYTTMSFVSPVASIPVGGVTAATLCLLSRRVGGSIVGSCGGFAIAYVVYALAGEKLSPDDPSRALLGLTAAFGVAGAAAVFKFQEIALIVTSSVSGASLALLGMAHFIKSFPDPDGLTAFRPLRAVAVGRTARLVELLAHACCLQRHWRARAVSGRRQSGGKC